jgi:DNA polymerase-3 subunit alpha
VSQLGAWTEGALAIGAVVTGIKRQVSRRSGAEFARLTVEDFSGSSEILVFPEAWAALSDRIRTDIPVLIKGGYSRRDQGTDNPTFIVESVQRLEEIRVSGQLTVSIDLSAGAGDAGGPDGEGVTPDIMRDVRSVVDAHPGQAPLEVRWSDGTGGVARLRSRALRMAASNAALSELRALLGQQRVRLIRGG